MPLAGSNLSATTNSIFPAQHLMWHEAKTVEYNSIVLAQDIRTLLKGFMIRLLHHILVYDIVTASVMCKPCHTSYLQAVSGHTAFKDNMHAHMISLVWYVYKAALMKRMAEGWLI